jgi:hypothetical protein
MPSHSGRINWPSSIIDCDVKSVFADCSCVSFNLASDSNVHKTYRTLTALNPDCNDRQDCYKHRFRCHRLAMYVTDVHPVITNVFPAWPWITPSIYSYLLTMLVLLGDWKKSKKKEKGTSKSNQIALSNETTGPYHHTTKQSTRLVVYSIILLTDTKKSRKQ